MMILSLGLLVLACRDAGGASVDDTTGSTGASAESTDPSTTATTTGTTTVPPDCTPGTEGCTCDAGACDGVLECWSQVCVMPPAASSSTEGTDSSSGGGETSAAIDESSSSTDADSSTTAEPAQPCELEGNLTCVDGMIDTCVGGVVQTQSCIEYCEPFGYSSTGCADINDCLCEGAVDEVCLALVAKYCGCQNQPCTEQQQAYYYGACVDPENNPELYDLLVCYSVFPADTEQECDIASFAC